MWKVLKYLLGGLAGFVVAVGYILVLVGRDVIQAGGFWGTPFPKGQHLITPLLAGGVMIGLLLAWDKKGRIPALVVTLLCLMPLFSDMINPPPSRVARMSRSRLEAQWRRDAGKLIEQENPYVSEAAVPRIYSACSEFLIWTRTGGYDKWYWYDGTQNRLTGSATAEQVQSVIKRYLPEGAHITRFTVDKQHPYEISFDFRAPTLNSFGHARIGLECDFELDVLDYLDGKAYKDQWPNAPLGQ